MNENNNITVIIPTYNRADLVTRALDSVIKQTYKDYEIIVVDDGSTDKTKTLLEPYRDIIKYIYKENGGKSTAQNIALKIAKGKWVAILDSDDYWHENKLEAQMDAIKKYEDCGLCFTDGCFINNPSIEKSIFKSVNKYFTHESGQIEDSVDYVLNPPHGIYIQSTVIRKELINSLGGFDEMLRTVGEDTDMIFRLSMVTKFCYVNRPLVYVDRTPNRTNGIIELFDTKPIDSLKSLIYMYEKWLYLSGSISDQHRSIIRRRRKDHSWRLIKEYLKKGRIIEAIEHYRYQIITNA